jgi:hypothetical protein
MGRGDLIGNSDRHLVPRTGGETIRKPAGARDANLPRVDQIAHKHGLVKPRAGGAIQNRATRPGKGSR